MFKSIFVYTILTISKSQNFDYFFADSNETIFLKNGPDYFNENFNFNDDRGGVSVSETSTININLKNISNDIKTGNARESCSLLMTLIVHNDDHLLKLFWDFHIYLFSILFTISSIYSIINILLFLTVSDNRYRKYFFFLNSMLLMSSTLRVIFLIYDSYNSNNLKLFRYFIYKTAYPSISSGFGLIFLIYFQSINLKFPRPFAVLSIITFHFLFSLISDIMSGWFGRYIILFMICQIIFITWSNYLSLIYLYNFRELLKIAIIKHGEYLRSTFTRSRANKTNFGKLNYYLVVKISLIVSILFILIAIINIYGLSALVFNFETCSPWSLWCYHTVDRSLEVMICLCCCFLVYKTRNCYYRYSMFGHFSCCNGGARNRNQNQCQISSSFEQSSELFSGLAPVKNSPVSRSKICNRNFITTINEESEICEDKGLQENMMCISKWNEFLYSSPEAKSEEQDSILACAGSKTPSLEDSHSPIFRCHYGRKSSPCSFATTDNSADTSDQLTPAKQAEGRLGSSCSSESAGNSFDVTLFRFWTREPHHVNGYTVSPLQNHPFRLDLRKDMVSVACGTEDITPDSAINVDVVMEERHEINTVNKCLSECDLNKSINKYGQRKTLSDGSHRKVFTNLKRNLLEADSSILT
ncbi:uncharacterized protein [Centruroides vittatus]|uniref:uncharacterized protein n=1 Tax=Centruroides vittatus TaxID=120091 RepID=UPI00350F57DA